MSIFKEPPGRIDDGRLTNHEFAASLEGKTIGLWANMKLNAVELMDHVEAALRARHDIAGVVRGKYHPARVMGTNEWPGIDACDAALLTHGD